MDVSQLSNLIGQQIEHVTCLECCKLYVGPKTFTCGHSLCHYCWSGRQTCPTCAIPVDRQKLQYNTPLDNLTKYVSALRKSFEDLFKIDFDEYQLQLEMSNETCHKRNTVKEWLENSQNRFSANSQPSQSQGSVEAGTSKVLVHDNINTRKPAIPTPPKAKLATVDQNEWDKIEVLPDTEELNVKNKENVMVPIDVIPFTLDSEYTTKIRRSKRNRDVKTSETHSRSGVSMEGNISKIESDKKSPKQKPAWTNVKKMKREFNKLNKLNHNKLNVSIEEFKKGQHATKKATVVIPVTEQQIFGIDENTPNNLQISEESNPVEPSKNNDVLISESPNIISEDHKEIIVKHVVKNNTPKKMPKADSNNAIDTKQVYKVPFFKNGNLRPKHVHSTNISHHIDISNSNFNYINITKTTNNFITIEIGKDCNNCVNIDHRVKLKKDCEIQTSLGLHMLCQSVDKAIKIDNIAKTQSDNESSKKNTAETDTVTAQDEITDTQTKITTALDTHKTQSTLKDSNLENDMDIFESEPINKNVHVLAKSKNVTSEIIPTTYKIQRTRSTDKRNRDEDDELPSQKKAKQMPNTPSNKRNTHDISECSYDSVMSKVFAKIDSDIKQSKEVQESVNESVNVTREKSNINQIYSENIFTTIERDKNCDPASQPSETIKAITSQNILTHNYPMEEDMEVEMVLGTPMQDHDSDKSVVEDTPQKNTSYQNMKLKNEVTRTTYSNENRIKSNESLSSKHRKLETDEVINISDVSLNQTTNKQLTTLQSKAETPVNIKKFVDQIRHKSTPVSRKHLDFKGIEDPEQTSCSNASQIGKTTQEREFMMEAFEQSLTVQSQIIHKVLPTQNKKFCVASSCLNANQNQKLMMFCSKRQWMFVEKYTKELTHLVVSVDEENKANRSVKYMCALSAGKWIVSYDWIEKCLQTNKVWDEQPYEVLDPTGDPSPRMSRTATRRLFCGTTFYCMPPFSVLDKPSLELMLEQAGGCVVNEPSEIRATNATPAILLAEPEHTQEDKFIYLAMDLGVVPVNFEWAINCLGTYTVKSIVSYLLCPAALVQRALSRWPSDLTADEDTNS